MAVLTGTDTSDTLLGTTAADSLLGLGGSDTLTGGLGNDTLEGGAGADSLAGGAGTDTATYAGSTAGVTVDLLAGTGLGGHAEGDVLAEIETVIGSKYADTLSSSTSGHRLVGGLGDDVFIVGNANVAIAEDAGGGTDEIRTALTTYSMASYANVERLVYTGTVAANLTGNTGDNLIVGGAGSDTLRGGAGADRIVGGTGRDTASFGSAVTIDLKTGLHVGEAAGDVFASIETYLGSSGSDVFVGNGRLVTFSGGAGSDTARFATSAAAVKVALGASGVTTVGAGGDARAVRLVDIEAVVGSSFNDTLTSSTSGHRLSGSAGDDLYVVGHAGVAIVEEAGAGDDEIRTALSTYSMASSANVERLNYTGLTAATLTGNGSDNVITGGRGDDTLRGGTGADTLLGGRGIDTVTFGAAVTVNLRTGVHGGEATGDVYRQIEVFVGSGSNDVFASGTGGNVIHAGAGTDTIDFSGSNAAVNVNLTTMVFAGGDATGDTLTGFERVVGSAHADTLASATGGHALVGGAGDDTFLVGHGGVTISESEGGGTDEVVTSLAAFSLASFAHVERLTYTGAVNFAGTGNAGDNVLTGGTGNDTLTGGDGGDTLTGGAGDDTLAGGTGADRIAGGDGTDTASYRAATAGVRIDLTTGQHGGEAAGDVHDGIEAFVGSGFDDTLVGSAAADVMDAIAGTDTVDYSLSDGAVAINLSAGTASGGHATGDRLTGFERVVGSAFADILASSTGGHTLSGGDGDDLYVVTTGGVSVVEGVGGGGDEIRTTLASYSLAAVANVERLTYTGVVNAALTGNTSANVLTGGGGDDTLTGGAGPDRLVGGAGIDTASYADGDAAIVVDLAAGVLSGFGAGDTFDGIERFVGTRFGDTFFASAGADRIDGGAGVDVVSYRNATAAVAIDLTTGVHGGAASGDVLAAVEIVEGSAFDDTFVGDGGDTAFIGGAGADAIDGRSGIDSVWYLASDAGVTVDLGIGVASGGDAAGDMLTSIEAMIGSRFADSIAGGADGASLEGAGGSDTIAGGAGADVIVGGIGSDLGGVARPAETGPQADHLDGGDGDDVIFGAGTYDEENAAGEDDTGSLLYGGAGRDTLTMRDGSAWGGEGDDAVSVLGAGVAWGEAGNDTLDGSDAGFALFGGDGADTLRLQLGGGTADGGEGGDTYRTNTALETVIRDTGGSGTDVVYLERVAKTSQLLWGRDGDDLILQSTLDEDADQTVVVLDDWYAGADTIEFFELTDGTRISGFAFG